jgi:5-hydroxyisourate hydrolase
MSAITTHVLDTSRGRPAAGVAVRLERPSADGDATVLGHGSTDADGRLRDLLPSGAPHYHVPLLLSPFGYSTYRGS